MFVVFFPFEIGDPYSNVAYLKWILAVGLSTWGISSKLVRSQVLLIKEKPYIETARASGAGDGRVLLHYILPEAFSIIASSVIYTVAIVLSVQSSLDVFGFRRFIWSRSPDLPPVTTAPFVSWGTMLSYGTMYARLEAWWTVLPPAFCIVLLGLSLTLIGNKVADALNPKL